MSKTSILVPSRNERFLPQTVADLLANAAGEVEVIAVLDGYWPNPPLPDDSRLHIIHRGTAMGMRAAINAAAAIAKGDYLLKCDAHCLFAQGFDEVLKADCEDNWLVVPRRKRLDAENWCIADPERLPIDHHYLSCPITNPDGYSMHGVPWNERTAHNLSVPIDDLMSFQGSCWFMSRKHWERLGGMSEEGYGTFCQEPQELGNKTWLGGGRIVVNKQTHYAHLHKGTRYGRGYPQSKGEIQRGHEYAGRYWMGNAWPGRVHDIEWLIDKFWPVPTWPDNWTSIRDCDYSEYSRTTAPAI